MRKIFFIAFMFCWFTKAEHDDPSCEAKHCFQWVNYVHHPTSSACCGAANIICGQKAHARFSAGNFISDYSDATLAFCSIGTKESDHFYLSFLNCRLANGTEDDFSCFNCGTGENAKTFCGAFNLQNGPYTSVKAGAFNYIPSGYGEAKASCFNYVDGHGNDIDYGCLNCAFGRRETIKKGFCNYVSGESSEVEYGCLNCVTGNNSKAQGCCNLVIDNKQKVSTICNMCQKPAPEKVEAPVTQNMQ